MFRFLCASHHMYQNACLSQSAQPRLFGPLTEESGAYKTKVVRCVHTCAETSPSIDPIAAARVVPVCFVCACARLRVCLCVFVFTFLKL